jgi:hypothetical protein
LHEKLYKNVHQNEIEKFSDTFFYNVLYTIIAQGDEEDTLFERKNHKEN